MRNQQSAMVVMVVSMALVHISYGTPSMHLPNTRQGEYAAKLSSYSIVTPARVSEEGAFITHNLHHAHHPSRSKRDTSSSNNEIHYLMTLDGKEHQVTLQPNLKFLAPHAVLERVRGSGVHEAWSEVIGTAPSCHYHGYVRNHTASRVALSTCYGLTGFLRTDEDEYLIEPVQDHTPSHPDAPTPHLVYKRSVIPSSGGHTCSTPDSYERAIHARSVWEAEREEGDTRKRKRRKRSVSVERNVEVTVVADKKMVEYYSNEDITTYILTVMNMVSSVFHDASIGNAVNIHVVRIMLLEDNQGEALEISHNADDSLKNFCQWQQMINPSNESHPHHHDVAVLLTRYNICSRASAFCSTLGVSEIAGMCQPLRSCNVNEDTGLQISYTIAHELGHNFGMNHDGPQNGCETLYGTYEHVMSPQLTNDAKPVTWSNCSRQEITHFLDRNWGSCLEDEPVEVEYNFPELPPGAMYDADHQCRLSYGQEATHCGDIEGMERVCQILWCRLNNRCITRMDPAAEGTQCGKHKWCSDGKCVTMGERPAAIHGNWGAWSPWSSCTRTCGAGVVVAVRHCDNPSPANGGRYCTGDRKRYRICNTKECPENGVSFRAVQCSEQGPQPYKGEHRTWLPVLYSQSPCQLNCKPDNEFYSVKILDNAMDGTPCKPGTRDMCIHGACRRVACDWTIDGEAQEDRCGLCHGDGTQCVTTRGVFNLTKGSGYVEAVTIPKDATNVKLEELQDAANYFAIRDNVTGKYYLNGDWVIHWSGEYSADGIMMYYNREGETEDLLLPGPLKRPLTFMLLFQTDNPGISWEYTLPHPNATYTPTFSWHFTDWSVCTVTCGGGTQVSRVQCMEKEAGLVEDRYCSSDPKPKDRSRVCNSHACPAWWWSGPWQPCSVTCGVDGFRRRTVICVRSFGPTEQMALLDSACDYSVKPHETEPCPSQASCPQMLEWRVGPWSRTCAQDPCEYEDREVECVAPGGSCDPRSRPPEQRQCGNITCGVWITGNWSKCSAPCGEGVKFRRVWCEGGLACRERGEPRSVQECTGNCLEEDTDLEIHEVLEDDPDDSSYTSTAGRVTTAATTQESATTTTTTSATTTTQAATPTTATSTIPTTSRTAPSSKPGTSSTTSTAPASTTTHTPATNNATMITSTEFTPTTTPTSDFKSTTTTPHTTTDIKIHPPPTTENPLRSTSMPDLSTTSASTAVPTTPPSSTPPHNVDERQGNRENRTATENPGPFPSPSPNSEPASTPPEAAIDTSTQSVQIPHPLDPDALNSTTTPSPDSTETHKSVAIPETAREGEEVTEKPDSEAGDGKVTAEDKFASTAAPEGERSSENSVTSTTTSKPLWSSEVMPETFNEIDVDSKPRVSKDEPLRDKLKEEQRHVHNTTETEVTPSSKNQERDGEVGNTTDHDLAISQSRQDATDIKEGKHSFNSTEPPHENTKEITTLEEPIERENTDETELEESLVEVMPGYDNNNNNNNNYNNEDDQERRPSESAVDKINVDDFEVIQVVELPPKGKKKKVRKKVLLYTGAEAVDALHDLAVEAESMKSDSSENTISGDCEWSIGSWSECTVECGGGSREREVVCRAVTNTTSTVVNPKHCPQPRPSSLQPCNTMECGEWIAGPWGNCSARCGTGERSRSVHCPEESVCPASLRPSEVEPCNPEPCMQWSVGPWSLCTKSCGGGYQIRHVKCVDMRTQESSSGCVRGDKPKHKMDCHNQRCPKNRRGQQRRCRDRLDSKLCKRLKHMCTTKFFMVKCCRTCLRRPG